MVRSRPVLREGPSGLERGGLGERARRGWGWPALALGIAGLVALPVLGVVASLLTPTLEVWVHLWRTRLGELVLNTAVLLLGVGAGTLLLGTGLAWLVVAHRFPGRGLLEWMLILPLAMPSYVIAFVMLSFFGFGGPVQTALRGWLGSSAGFPEVRSGGGAVLVMSLVLYPYVYLLARAAFLEQGAALLEAARTLGYGRLKAFFRVALPLARPSLAVGTALALMEALADIGTVSLLGFPTLSWGVYRVWLGLREREAALELAGLLLLFALGLLGLERRLRGRARYERGGGRPAAAEPLALRGWKGWTATAACSLVVGAAFGLPFLQLGVWAWGQVTRGALNARYLEFAGNTLTLAGVTAALALLLALFMAYGVRLHRGPAVRLAAWIAATGYAIPGAVVAMGILAPLVALEHSLGFLSRLLGDPGRGLWVLGSGAGLVYAYLVRFMAVAYHPVEASLEKVTPSMDMAARSLGMSAAGALRRVHLPLIRTGMLTGAVLVFVDVMKELPATLLLRPLGYDTLAVRVWQMTSESLWEEAALPALTIVLAGLLPILLLIRASRGNRTFVPPLPYRALGRK